MPAKDTNELENELNEADNVKKFLDNNAENFRKFTLAEYLKHLLDEKILSLALAMKLSPKETDYLLYYAGHNKLYARNERDAVIAFALENHKTVLQTNELLKDLNMLPLIGG